MVYITSEDGKEKKFACIKCIKGHRSSKCNHTNRELFEIKKKGRPVSQCEQCRQLRKTKQIHIKCICLNLKAKEAIDESTATPITPSSVEFRHSELSDKVTPNSNALPPAPIASSCAQCDRPRLYCNCKKEAANLLLKTAANDLEYMSSSSSDGSVTPPVLSYPERPLYSAGLNDNSIHTSINSPLPTTTSSTSSSPIIQTSPILEKNPNLRHLTIPIHDPSDDIDSDTPIYKSHEENTTLGEFTNTSSEELMTQIYSGFIGDKDGKLQSSSSSSPLLREADHQLAELSKED